MNRILLLFLSLLLLSDFASAQAYISVPGDTSGYTNGSLQITDGGAAIYSVPLIISPGTNGVQPSLALAYNSQGGNSIVGQGWSLQGISAISRAAQTYAQDHKALGISFNYNDRFALDGERLVPTDSTVAYGSDGSEYRTEQNAFCKINSFGSFGGLLTPKYFVVKTNSGNIMEYGNTPDSRIRVAGVNTVFWLVNKISDTKGNYFTFTYFQDSISGEYYPTRIDYTGNASTGLVPYASVQFFYEGRKDSSQKYLNGVTIANNKHRLIEIKSFFGTTLVRDYKLAYQYSPANISQLISVKECGSDGHCHTPTNFIWSNISTPSFGAVDIGYINKSHPSDVIISTDYNADGTQDILVIPQSGSASVQAYISNKSRSSLSFNPVAFDHPINVTQKFSVADFNGDGKSDFLLYDTTATGSSSFYLNTDSLGSPLLTVNPAISPIPFHPIFDSNKIVATIDFNGDGRSDIISFNPNNGRNYWLFSNTIGTAGVSFIPNGSSNYFTGILPDSLFTGTYEPFFADYNGDGLMDILFWNIANGRTQIWQNNSSGGLGAVSFTNIASNVINPSHISATGGTITTADVNGDGLPDIMYYVKSTGLDSVWINTGKDVFIKQNPSVIGSNLDSLIKNGSNLLQLDFNGDGYADLVWIDTATGRNRWFVNDGKLNFTQLTGTVIDSTVLKHYNIQGSGNFSKSIFDFYLFNTTATPASRMLIGTAQSNSLITQIRVGSGQVFDINYELLTNDSICKKSNNATYPLMDYQATQFVVKNWQTDNGVGTKSVTSYRYIGAKVHLLGRGFRGYSEVDITDENTGIVNKRYYLSDTNSWKYISAPLVRNVTMLPTGVIISETNIENGINQYFNGKCNYSYVHSNSSKTYEIDGSFVDSTRITYLSDDYGNVYSTVTEYGDGMKDSLVNHFRLVDTAHWLVSRLDTSRLYRTIPGHPMITKSSAFVYDISGGTGLLLSEITETDSNVTVRKIKNYTYDGIGNITSVSETAWSGIATTTETRTTHTTYDALGRYAVSFTNAQGQTTYKTTDPLLGKTLTETDLNGLVKTYYYDGFGRPTKTVYPDGNWSTTDYRKSVPSFPFSPSLATTVIYQQSSFAPPVIAYYDLLNRQIRKQKKGFSGGDIFTDIVYDNKGLAIQQSLPYYNGATAIYAQSFYDIIGRSVSVIEPGGRVDSVLYNGRTTTYRNAKGQRKTIIKNAKEQMIRAKDNEGHNLSYEYDAAGRLLKTTDPAGNNIIITYDIHGNKIKMQDPDMGTCTYVTNGFGELVKQTDPLAHVITMTYDSLSRIKTRTEPEGTTKWIYDNRPHGIGLLGVTVSYNGFTDTVTYDSLSRPISYRQIIDTFHSYTQSNTYDNLGRVHNTIYPSGFAVRNSYNSFGYLYQVSDTFAGGRIYWTADSLNAKDEMTLQHFGNGTTTSRVYDDNTDFLTGINTKLGVSYLQKQTYTYDAIGNLQQRNDLLLSKTENFDYDDLNRLTKSHVLGMDSVMMSYDALGNILTKSDVGAYHYGGTGAGPHQVQSIDVTTTQCIPSLLINTQYNSFNKVSQISKDSSLVDIYYSPSRQRNLQKMYVNGSLVRTKIYVSANFEQEIKGGDTVTTNYIAGGGAIIGSYVTHTLSSHPAAISYYHRDHLGSLVMVTDSVGNVTAHFSFDAWGKRRNADWSSLLTDSLSLTNDRGFTGHEHYDLFDIVDMNGRVYDPVLGRFLSADPYIQDMTNLQCFNRYSYVCNNPLSFTDPTGFFSLGHFFHSIFKGISHAVSSAISSSAKWLSNNWRQIAVAAVSIAASYFSCGLLAGILNPMLTTICSGAAGGFASGVSATLLNGGNLGQAFISGLRSGVISAASAYATFEIAEFFPSADKLNPHATDETNVIPKMIGHGIVQGSSSVANGGKFLNGFISGSVVTFANQYTDNLKDNTSKIAASAALGGTVSAVTGGSFANGAISGAYIEMFNDCSSSIQLFAAKYKLFDFSNSTGMEGDESCLGAYGIAGGEYCRTPDGVVLKGGIGLGEIMPIKFPMPISFSAAVGDAWNINNKDFYNYFQINFGAINVSCKFNIVPMPPENPLKMK